MFKFKTFSMILLTYMAMACSTPQPQAEAVDTPKAEAEAVVAPPKDASVKAKKAESLLKEVEKRYTSTQAFSAKVKKTLKLKLLDQERVQEGTLQIKKPGMFRFEFTGTENSLALTDGKTIWVVTYPTDPDFDNTVRVVRSKDPKKVQSQTLAAFILGQGSLLKQYKVKSQKTEGDVKIFVLESKNKSEDIKKMTVKVFIPKKEILSIEYADQLENITIIELSENKFDQKIDTKQFKFSVPKGAEVTDI